MPCGNESVERLVGKLLKIIDFLGKVLKFIFPSILISNESEKKYECMYVKSLQKLCCNAWREPERERERE